MSLKINCGGQIFETYSDTIEKLPYCPLKVCILNTGFSQDDKIFIDISPYYFEFTLSFLRNEINMFRFIEQVCHGSFCENKAGGTNYIREFMGWKQIIEFVFEPKSENELYNEEYSQLFKKQKEKNYRIRPQRGGRLWHDNIPWQKETAQCILDNICKFNNMYTNDEDGFNLTLDEYKVFQKNHYNRILS